MQNVIKKSGKTIEEYRHNIKLLKYYLKKEQKINQTLKYKENKMHQKKDQTGSNKKKPKGSIYSMLDVVAQLNVILKEMGLVLGDIFRMADGQYEGEITKEQFMKTIMKIKSNLSQTSINEMFYAIDTNMNGLLSTDQYNQYLLAHGGSDSKEALSFQRSAGEALIAAFKKKGMKYQQLLENKLNPVKCDQMMLQLKKLGLDGNQSMILLKMWDPSLTGEIKHEIYLNAMKSVKQKDQKQIQNQKMEKGVQELCVILRDRKLNPMQIFQESQNDGQEGISILQLQEGLKKLMPEQTAYQIKKWVNLINLNGDSTISKEQFVSAIRSFYSMQQIDKFTNQYQKLHPKLKTALKNQQIPAEKIIHNLQIYIQDNSLTKTEVFYRIDLSHDGFIDKEELIEGLKTLGMNIGQIGKVLTVFDRDANGAISLKEWLAILGEDLEMEDVSEIIEEPKPSKKKEEVKDKKKEEVKDKKEDNKNSKVPAKKIEKVIKPDSIDKSSKDNKKSIEKNDKSDSKKDLLKKQSVKKQPIKKQEKKEDINKSVSVPKIKPNEPKPAPTKPNQLKKSKEPLQPKNKNTDIKPTVKVSEKQDDKSKEKRKQDPAANESLELQKVVSEQQPQIIDFQIIEKEIGQIYGKNASKTLQVFKANSNKKTSITKTQLTSILNALKLKTVYTDQQIVALFQSNVSSNGLIEYKQWLEGLLDKYQIQSVKEQVPTLPDLKNKQLISKLKDDTNTKKRDQPKQKRDQPKQKRDQPKQKRDQPKQKRDQPKQKQGDTNKQELQNQKKNKKKQIQLQLQSEHPSLLEESKEENYQEQFQNDSILKSKQQKRGQNNQNFKIIMDLLLQNQQHTDDGYKLSSYISCDAQLELLNQTYLPRSISLKKNKKKFKDASFPDTIKSLTDPTKGVSSIQYVSMLKWKNYSQVYKKAEVFQGNIQPTDIKQGGLGDCYFLCSLACLAEYKKIIERLFEYYDLENGYFLVWLCIDGSWKLYEIDGYFPFQPNNNSFAFSYGVNQELWVMILEKAYAKAYGSYQKISGGVAYQAIKDLTGAPGKAFNHQPKQQDKLWAKLVDANKNKYLMACGTDKSNAGKIKKGGHAEGITQDGLVLGHAYSILDVVVYQQEKLIQLRNPWGNTEWKGDWSDQSNKWTEQAKKALNYNSAKEDGIFWMNYNEFFNNYAQTTINYLHPDYYYISQKKKGKSILIKINSNSYKHGYLMVTQHDHRFEGLPIQASYVHCNIIACNYRNGKITKKLDSYEYSHEHQGLVEISQTQKGEQTIVLVILNESTDVTISTYADSKISCQIQQNIQKQINYYESIASMEPAPNKIYKVYQLNMWLCRLGQYGFMTFKNPTCADVKLTLFNFTSPNNITLQKESYQMNLKPNGVYCLRGKIIDLNNNSMGFGSFSSKS